MLFTTGSTKRNYSHRGVRLTGIFVCPSSDPGDDRDAHRVHYNALAYHDGPTSSEEAVVVWRPGEKCHFCWRVSSPKADSHATRSLLQAHGRRRVAGNAARLLVSCVCVYMVYGIVYIQPHFYHNFYCNITMIIALQFQMSEYEFDNNSQWRRRDAGQRKLVRLLYKLVPPCRSSWYLKLLLHRSLHIPLAKCTFV